MNVSLAEIGESGFVLEDFIVDTRYIPQLNSAVIDVLPEMAEDSILVTVKAGITTGLASTASHRIQARALLSQQTLGAVSEVCRFFRRWRVREHNTRWIGEHLLGERGGPECMSSAGQL